MTFRKPKVGAQAILGQTILQVPCEDGAQLQSLAYVMGPTLKDILPLSLLCQIKLTFFWVFARKHNNLPLAFQCEVTFVDISVVIVLSHIT